MLKLPKEFHPDFSVPGRKPVSGVEIDWSSPLSKGLLRAWFFNPGALLVDLVAGHELTSNAAISTKIAGVTDRANFAVSVDSSNYLYTDGNYRSQISDQVTAFCDFDYQSGVNGFIFGDVQLNGGDFNWGLYSDGGADWRFFVKNTGGSSAAPEILDDTTPESMTLAGTYDGSNIRLYKNGALGSTAALTGNVQQNALNTSFDRWNNAYDESIDYKVALLFNRVLSDDEILSLHKNPYQILKPANDLYLFVPSSGATYTITPETGTFSLTGGALSLLHNKSLSPGTGSLTTSGGNVSLLYNRVINPETGSLSVTGNSINVLYNRQLTPGTGSFSLTGDPITLTYTPSGATYTLTPETGLFAVTGGAVSLLHNKKLTPEAGTFSLTGGNVGLLYNRALAPSTGSFTLSVSAINLYANRQITLGTGTLSVTGSSITLTYSSAVVPNTPDSRTLSINAYTRTLNANTRIRFIVADEQDRNL